MTARPSVATLAATIPLLFALASGCGPSPVDETPIPTPTLGGDIGDAFVDGDQDGYIKRDDCDDTDALSYPGAPELCDAADNDCDEAVDEGFDADGDGSLSAAACADLGGDDCNDQDPFTGPAQSESCDTRDNDCDGDVDEASSDGTLFYADTDGDGAGDPAASQTLCQEEAPEGYVANGDDCDDSTAEVGAKPTWYEDSDGDGFGDDSTATRSCDAPGADYTTTGGDCNDAFAAVAPNAQERCNGADDDCDGNADEGVQTTYYGDVDGDGYGDDTTAVDACSPPGEGYTTTGGDCDDTRTNVNPGMTDFCDDTDNDCDGDIDEPDNQSVPWWYSDLDGDGYGDPESGVRTCTPAEGLTENHGDCDDSDAGVNPGATDLCNDGIDQDCSGADNVCG